MLFPMRARPFYVLMLAMALGCGSSSAGDSTRVARSASHCDTAEACLQLCGKQTTSDACQRAADKRCAAHTGESCNDVARVNRIFAVLLARAAPTRSAHHKATADENAEKACRYGVATACKTQIVRPAPPTPRPNPFAKPPPPPTTGLKIVSKLALEHLRIRGTDNIDPPRSVQQAMRRDGKKQLITLIKVCIDTSGAISSQKRLTPTRYYRYEVKLRRLIGQWRFRPYTEHGRRHPACSVYTFYYTAP